MFISLLRIAAHLPLPEVVLVGSRGRRDEYPLESVIGLYSGKSALTQILLRKRVQQVTIVHSWLTYLRPSKQLLRGGLLSQSRVAG